MTFPTIHINGNAVGSDLPTYIIAEIGINHNGDPSLARTLVDEAAETGANAVKFQKRCLSRLYPEEMLDHPETYEQQFQYMIPLLKKVELAEKTISELREQALSLGLDFLCTPFDITSADFLDRIGVHAFKIASADLNNQELLAHITAKKRPVILSTGMSFRDEIEQTVRFLKKEKAEFALLHCRSSYPVWPREVNLKMITWLKQYDVPVGYSGHDIGIVIPLVAASMGACIIEKHITRDKSMEGPDHKISLEPFEFKRMVRDIRIADQAMAKASRFLLRGEVVNREVFGKSLTAKTFLPKGTVVKKEMIMARGPGKGLAPSALDRLLGQRLTRDIREGGLFLESDIGESEPDRQVPDWGFKSKWGLISRFSDFHQMIEFNPKVVEIHLAEKDLNQAFALDKPYPQELIVHVAEYMEGRLMDLCSSDQAIRKASVELVNQTARRTAGLAGHFQGKAKLIAHPGAMSLNAKLNKTDLRHNLIQSLNEIDPFGCELLLENLPPYPWYFGGAWKGNYFMDEDEIQAFCRETGINIVFDISHAALYCNAKAKDLSRYIRTIYPHIRHIHMGDGYGVDGEGVQIHEGDIDFDRIMPLFSDYRESWVPEIWRGHLNQGQGFFTAIERLARYDF